MPTWLHFYPIGASVRNLKLVGFTILNSQVRIHKFEFILRAQKVHRTPARFFISAQFIKSNVHFLNYLKIVGSKI